MREICITQSLTNHNKRKNLKIVETIDQENFVARAEKKYSYFVTEQTQVKDVEELKLLQDQTYKKKDRHVSIKKMFDPKTGMGQMVYRVIGSFYVVQNLHVFAVVFMHSIKFDMLSRSLPKL